MREVYVVSAVRTPIGRFGGSLKDHSPVDLAAHAMKAALEAGSVAGGDLDLYTFGISCAQDTASSFRDRRLSRPESQKKSTASRSTWCAHRA